MKPFIVAFAVLAFAVGAVAEWALRPVLAPVDRLARNVHEHLKKNPKDAQAHYVLGRIHSMAFALGTNQVTHVLPFNPDAKAPVLPRLPPWMGVVRKRNEKQPRPLTPERLLHLEASLRHYENAAELDAKNHRARLGFAWMLEEGWNVREALTKSHELGLLKKLPDDAAKRVTGLAERAAKLDTAALDVYRDVMKRVAAKDKARNFQGPEPDSLLSIDAATAILRILETRPQLAVKEQAERESMKKHLAAMATKPRLVTPIIFPMDKPRPMNSLLASNGWTSFDLDADGIVSQWPWVKADTGLLVWDPHDTGKIRDGRQLFGSVTWWIFWNHGYEPLAALDNNRDGRLTDDELAGLAVWRDANSNGRSDHGEVLPVSTVGICEINCVSERSGGIWQSSRGLRLKDGRWLPTYDWTPRSRSVAAP